MLANLSPPLPLAASALPLVLPPDNDASPVTFSPALLPVALDHQVQSQTWLNVIHPKMRLKMWRWLQFRLYRRIG